MTLSISRRKAPLPQENVSLGLVRAKPFSRRASIFISAVNVSVSEEFETDDF